MFKGVYHGRAAHAPDLPSVLRRAQHAGVERVIVTAGCVAEAHEAVALCRELATDFPGMLTATVGVHPTRSCELVQHAGGPEACLQDLAALLARHRDLAISAIGELGLGLRADRAALTRLDYDRTQFAAPDVQRRCFEAQLALAEHTRLPLFLHLRNAAADFIEIVARNRERFPTGVVHSFTGTRQEAEALLDLDLFIGVNGCSLKSAEGLAVVQSLPLDRLMVESDAPWCEIRPAHAGSAHVQTRSPAVSKEKHTPDAAVKSRNEPLAARHRAPPIVSRPRQVLEVLAALHGAPLADVADTVFSTTVGVFG